MELSFVFVGRVKERYLEEGVADYLGRVRRYLRAEVRLVKAEARGGATDGAKALAKEALRLSQALAGADYVICLDKGGRQLTSEGLAALLDELMRRGVKRAAFVIGGASGLPPEVAARANLTLSLGAMTFTHEMSRLILLEQTYRALTIRAGEPYHK